MKSATVLIPVYNGEEYIERCLQSMLHQSYPNYKILVVDDGSTDRTLEILKKYPQVEVLSYKQNKGISYALNLGIDHIDTDYIIRMDADDRSHYDRIRIQVEFMEKNPHIFMSACTNYQGKPPNNQWDIYFSNKIKTTKELRLFYLYHPCLLHPSFIYRTKEWKAKGYRYDSRFDGVEDFELHRRIIMEEEVCEIQVPLICLESREGSASGVGIEKTLERLRRVNKHFYESLGILSATSQGTTTSQGATTQGATIDKMGKTLFPRLYKPTKEELDEVKSFTLTLLEKEYFKKRLEKSMVERLFEHLYKEIQE